jgi:hypothetical protein
MKLIFCRSCTAIFQLAAFDCILEPTTHTKCQCTHQRLNTMSTVWLCSCQCSQRSPATILYALQLSQLVSYRWSAKYTEQISMVCCMKILVDRFLRKRDETLQDRDRPSLATTRPELVRWHFPWRGTSGVHRKERITLSVLYLMDDSSVM